ncbi:MAG: glycerol transport system ATP-binding protein [Candidatus Azotimanducaceae bacterium]|jgi:glycerol transport system ATP-binding protein
MLQIDHLTTVDLKVSLDNISFLFEAGNIYTILGRTGAGKTELLRALMGLNPLVDGDIKLDGKSLAKRPIRDRDMSLVYQQFINYPHLSVLDNVAFPLRRQGKKKAEAQSLASEILATVGLSEFLQRRPAQLSGGQQQRVALARAMVKHSRILMLDEPLANLDYKLREQLREEFPRLVAGNDDSVILYTTTEPREAMELGNTMIIMNNGRIVASGSPADLFAHPPTKDAASVISDPPISFISGFVRSKALYFGEGQLAPSGGLKLPPDGPVTIALRPDAIEPGGAFNATIGLSEFSGSETIIHLDFDFGRAIMLVEGIHTFETGDALSVSIQAENIMLFAPNGRNITTRTNQDG